MASIYIVSFMPYAIIYSTECTQKKGGNMIEITMAVLADSANVSQEGKLNILGIFENINAQNFPVTHPTMALVLCFHAERGDMNREHNIVIDFVDDDGHKILDLKGSVKIGEAPPGERFKSNQIIFFNGVQFPKPGVYEFKIIINGEERSSVPITAKKITISPESIP
jgi:hypothetical protein